MANASQDQQRQRESDGRLIRAFVQRQDQGAFAALMRRHIRMVYSVCLRDLLDPDLAQDAVQAVFLVLAQKAHTLRAGAVLPSWLFQTARLACREILRKERRRMRLERTLIDREAEREQAGFADAELWSRTEPLLNDALAKLRPAERDALLLRYLEGLSLRETGEALGLTEDAARMRVSRAVDKVRRHVARAGVPLSAAALAALLHERAAASPPASGFRILSQDPHAPPGTTGLANPAAREISRGVLRTMNLYQLKLTALLLAGVLGILIPVARTGQNYLETANGLALWNSVRAASHKITNLEAKVLVTYTLDGKTYVRTDSIKLKRPNRFLLHTGEPYNSLYVSDGTHLQVHEFAGPGHFRDRSVPIANGEVPEELMTSPLAYLFLSDKLEAVVKSQVGEETTPREVGEEKRNGVHYRVLEARGGKGELLRLYVNRAGMVSGMDFERPQMVTVDLPDGNRDMHTSKMTGSMFLQDVRTGRQIPESAFAVGPAKLLAATVTRPSLIAAGAPAPGFTVTSPVDNTQASLAGLLQGKQAVLVNFWFMGCSPCREEFAALQKVYNEFKDRGLGLIAVNTMDSSQDIRRFCRDHPVGFRVGVARRSHGYETDDLSWEYGVAAFPTNVLIGADGKVLWRGIGYNEQELRQALALAGCR